MINQLKQVKKPLGKMPAKLSQIASTPRKVRPMKYSESDSGSMKGNKPVGMKNYLGK